jgi:hypothetical protein
MSSYEPTAWRDGKSLVLSRHSPVAPDRCVFTNDLVFENSKISRRLSWGNEGPTKWLPTKIKLLWALADMRLVTVTFGLSGRARAMRTIMLALSVAGAGTGAILFVEGLRRGTVPPPMGYVGGGAALMAVALTVFMNCYSILDIVAMDDEFIWLRGAKQAFLESLPEYSPRNQPNQEPQPTSPTGRR